ncbi:MAG: hypothetical protein WAL56_22670 [Candidatus Sulfotelmatobacter sp.]
MRAKTIATSELSLELKYCERCGGLWLRPVGGPEIYCMNCARAMAELPPASHEEGRARVPRGPKLGNGDGLKGYAAKNGIDMDAAGGVA